MFVRSLSFSPFSMLSPILQEARSVFVDFSRKFFFEGPPATKERKLEASRILLGKHCNDLSPPEQIALCSSLQKVPDPFLRKDVNDLVESFLEVSEFTEEIPRFIRVWAEARQEKEENIFEWNEPWLSETLDKIGKGSLLHLSVERGLERVVTLLLKEKGVNIEAQDVAGNTPLHLVAESDNEKIAVLLLKNGSNVDARNVRGKTPLGIALIHGNLSLVRMFVRCSATISEDEFSRLMKWGWKALSARSNLMRIDAIKQVGKHVQLSPKDEEEFEKLLAYDVLDKAKILAHWLNISGRIDLKNEFSEKLGGGCDNDHFVELFAELLEDFIESDDFKKLKISPVKIKAIQNALKEVLIPSKFYAGVVKKINNKELVFLPAGWDRHTICLVFYGDYLGIGNRGERGSYNTIEVFKVDPELMTDEIIQDILRLNFANADEAMKFFYEVLPAKLSRSKKIERDKFCALIQQILPKSQNGPFCTLASLEAGLRFAWVVLDPPEKRNLKQAKLETKVFTDWAATELYDQHISLIEDPRFLKDAKASVDKKSKRKSSVVRELAIRRALAIGAKSARKTAIIGASVVGRALAIGAKSVGKVAIRGAPVIGRALAIGAKSVGRVSWKVGTTLGRAAAIGVANLGKITKGKTAAIGASYVGGAAVFGTVIGATIAAISEKFMWSDEGLELLIPYIAATAVLAPITAIAVRSFGREAFGEEGSVAVRTTAAVAAAAVIGPTMLASFGGANSLARMATRAVGAAALGLGIAALESLKRATFGVGSEGVKKGASAVSAVVAGVALSLDSLNKIEIKSKEDLFIGVPAVVIPTVIAIIAGALSGSAYIRKTTLGRTAEAFGRTIALRAAYVRKTTLGRAVERTVASLGKTTALGAAFVGLSALFGRGFVLQALARADLNDFLVLGLVVPILLSTAATVNAFGKKVFQESKNLEVSAIGTMAVRIPAVITAIVAIFSERAWDQTEGNILVEKVMLGATVGAVVALFTAVHHSIAKFKCPR